MMNRDGNPIISFPGDDNIIVWEILSRLPVKSLLRFKCVCKFWRNIIQNDPRFRYLHLTRSKSRSGLLLVMTNLKYPKLRFLSANLFEGRRAEIHTITDLCYIEEDIVEMPINVFTMDLCGKFDIVGMPINGLICFRDLETNSVRICNLGTRESTPWIKSKVEEELQEEEDERIGLIPTFVFVYDPATKEHKVICEWEIERETRSPHGDFIIISTVCEVLTVGRNSWRKIDEFPQLRSAVSVCVNGVIYWRMCPRVHSIYLEYGVEDENDIIVSFDLGSEKLGAIQIPSFILNQPQALKEFSGKCSDLLEVDGRVALLHRMSAKTAKLWVFHDDTTTSNSSSNNWIEETISLPFGSSEVHFQPIAGTDQIIVTCNNHVIYSYDRKWKTFKEIEISGISPHRPRYSLVTTFVESLLPVQQQPSTSNDSASIMKLKRLSL